MGGKLDGAVGNGQPQRGADSALDQPDVAAMGANELSGDGKAQAGTAGAGRALERFEQMGSRLFREARAGVGHFDYHHRALAAAGDADLSRPGSRVSRLSMAPTRCAIGQEDTEQLVVIGLDDETALDRADPADRRIGAEAERLMHLFDQRLEQNRPASGGGSCRRP